jgi:hypothetical protein
MPEGIFCKKMRIFPYAERHILITKTVPGTNFWRAWISGTLGDAPPALETPGSQCCGVIGRSICLFWGNCTIVSFLIQYSKRENRNEIR